MIFINGTRNSVFLVFQYKPIFKYFPATEDKNQRGNSNPGRIGVSENIIIKSTPKVTAENTTNVITNTPKQLTPITESIIDIGSLSTLTFPEVIQNETSNPNDEQTTDTGI